MNQLEKDNKMEETVATNSEKKTISHYYRKWKHSVYFWLYLNIWCRYCYQHVMKLMHKFNLHYTVVLDIREEKTELSCTLQRKHLWCRWCGLRGEVLKFEHDE